MLSILCSASSFPWPLTHFTSFTVQLIGSSPITEDPLTFRVLLRFYSDFIYFSKTTSHASLIVCLFTICHRGPQPATDRLGHWHSPLRALAPTLAAHPAPHRAGRECALEKCLLFLVHGKHIRSSPPKESKKNLDKQRHVWNSWHYTEKFSWRIYKAIMVPWCFCFEVL